MYGILGSSLWSKLNEITWYRYSYKLNLQSNTVNTWMISVMVTLLNSYYIPRRKSGIYWIQVRRAAAAAAAAVEISLWTR